MGSSHHAIEDLAALSGLPNMNCYVPAFIEDMKGCLSAMFQEKRPSYFRLGLGKNMPSQMKLTEYGASTSENKDARVTVIAQGPVANNLVAAMKENLHSSEVDLFIVNRMPFTTLPDDIGTSIRKTGKVLVIEEHISTGGLGSAISLLVNENGIPVTRFRSLRAEGYPSGLFGSQSFHQQESGLDEGNISRALNEYF
jgi:transketolase